MVHCRNRLRTKLVRALFSVIPQRAPVGGAAPARARLGGPSSHVFSFLAHRLLQWNRAANEGCPTQRAATCG